MKFIKFGIGLAAYHQLQRAAAERGLSVAGLVRMIVMDWLNT